MAAKKKSDLELERDYIAALSKKRLPKKVKTAVKKTVVRKVNPSLATHAVKDKVHREAILLVERAVSAMKSVRMSDTTKQANLSHAEGFIAGALASGVISKKERDELINALDEAI